MRQAPPLHPWPQVAAELGKLEESREHVEAGNMYQLQLEFNKAVAGQLWKTTPCSCHQRNFLVRTWHIAHPPHVQHLRPQWQSPVKLETLLVEPCVCLTTLCLPKRSLPRGLLIAVAYCWHAFRVKMCRGTHKLMQLATVFRQTPQEALASSVLSVTADPQLRIIPQLSNSISFGGPAQTYILLCSC